MADTTHKKYLLKLYFTWPTTDPLPKSGDLKHHLWDVTDPDSPKDLGSSLGSRTFEAGDTASLEVHRTGDKGVPSSAVFQFSQDKDQKHTKNPFYKPYYHAGTTVNLGAFGGGTPITVGQGTYSDSTETYDLEKSGDMWVPKDHSGVTFGQHLDSGADPETASAWNFTLKVDVTGPDGKSLPFIFDPELIVGPDR